MSYFKCGQIFVTDNSNTSIKDATGAIASFNTLLASPLVSLKAGFIATQESGTPTPSAPKAINGVSSIKVTNYGGNDLLSGVSFELGYINSQGNIASSTVWSVSDYIAVTPSKTYIAIKLATSGSGAYCASYKTDKTLSRTFEIVANQPTIISLNDDEYFLRVSIRSATPQTFGSHLYIIGSDITIALGGTYYGGYIQKDASGSKLVLTYEKKKFSDITNWYKGNLNTAGTGRQWYMDLNSNPTYDSANNSLCNSFYKSGASWGALGLYEYYSTTRYFICVIEDNYNDKAEMLASYGNVEVTLLLKTPIELPLTDIPDITTFVGDNNIFNDSENTEVKYTASPFVIGNASGSVANFTTPYTKPLISLQASVDAVQDLHGQSGAYHAGGSAQIWDEEWEVGRFDTTTGADIVSNTQIRSKNQIPIVPNTNYYFRISSGVGNAYFIFFDSNHSVIENPNVPQGTSPSGNSVYITGEFTTPDNAYYMRFYLMTAYGTTYNNDISVNYPSTDKTYHPYSNICPITGVSMVNRTNCGINLFDKTDSNAAITAYFTNSVIISATGSSMKTVLVRCNANTKYTVSKTAGQRFSVAYTKELPADGVSVYGYIANHTASNISITTGAGAKYLIAFVYNANFDSGTPEEMLASVQIVEGTDTVYHPYTGITTTIQLGDTYYGGYVTQDNNGLKLVVTHNIVKFNELTWNSENWGSYPQFNTSLNDAKSNTVTSNLGGLVCEIYSEVTPSYMYSNPNTAICLNNKVIRVRDSSFATKAEWEQATANYRFVYPLETPTEISLTDIDDIITLVGTNNIFADSGDIVECKYWGANT